jgi:hypothetical protein
MMGFWNWGLGFGKNISFGVNLGGFSVFRKLVNEKYSNLSSFMDLLFWENLFGDFDIRGICIALFDC